ncbi:MAG: hypothetical protein HQ518_26280 [Rhodopirellula sp.]|nr:hypothetical protein [Rhodopirellula sp.]
MKHSALIDSGQINSPPCDDDMAPCTTINPANGEVLCEYYPHDPMTVEQRIDRASTTAAFWKRNSLNERCDVSAALRIT